MLISIVTQNANKTSPLEIMRLYGGGQAFTLWMVTAQFIGVTVLALNRFTAVVSPVKHHTVLLHQYYTYIYVNCSYGLENVLLEQCLRLGCCRSLYQLSCNI